MVTQLAREFGAYVIGTGRAVDRRKALDLAPRNTPMMYPALKGRLVETRGFLQGVQPDEIASAQSHTYALTPPIVRG
jgi:hypothetical protein